jgi:glutathione S-transferase
MNAAPLLVMGSKNYSSWSLRPWLFLRKVGFDFREHVIHFDEPDYQAQIAVLSPSRRVPLLIDGIKIHDSLAICEYAAEHTGRGLPRERTARAMARAAGAEMHSGFPTLRHDMPMNVRALGRKVPATDALSVDIARIDSIWSESRATYGVGGSWLFGEFSIADAMFAPVVFRFRTYGAALSDASAAYVRHALSDPEMTEWLTASQSEGHPLAEADAFGVSGDKITQ